ncbi:uncharacterized protein PAC_06343 [Phialocephala subalpina]|uniref:Acetylxylan esterase n=1 Tax=Phialocephala subalpina TaxID=576137 RepID=A0A1L7WUJ7_9HELO|nr:uncharacterized protein PAC_06343 [Phialocephala subalpina]
MRPESTGLPTSLHSLPTRALNHHQDASPTPPRHNSLRPPLPLYLQSTTCASGVHIIVTRASNEHAGQGIIGSVATSVINQIPGSDSVAVDYPASLYNYQSLESQGVTAKAHLIENYVQICPQGKIVLIGYSQGAQVIVDTLIGSSTGFGGGFGGRSSSGLAEEYRKNIIADPSHVSNLSFDVSTSVKNGVNFTTFPPSLFAPSKSEKETD